jgi:hypothetical protein
MLFRPEEIVVASRAAVKDHRLRRDDFHQFTALEDNVNALGAVRAGIVDRHALIGVSAADQQPEVNRSRDVENLAS